MAVDGICPDGCPATPAQGDASSGGEDSSSSSDTLIIAAMVAGVVLCCLAAALAMFFCKRNDVNGDGKGRQAFDNPLCTNHAPRTTRTCNRLIRAGRHCCFVPNLPFRCLPLSALVCCYHLLAALWFAGWLTHSPGLLCPRSIADGEAPGKTDGFGFDSSNEQADTGYLSVGPNVENNA